jgi:hypothetical protein
MVVPNINEDYIDSVFGEASCLEWVKAEEAPFPTMSCWKSK